jgi:hypothetical protein
VLEANVPLEPHDQRHIVAAAQHRVDLGHIPLATNAHQILGLGKHAPRQRSAKQPFDSHNASLPAKFARPIHFRKRTLANLLKNTVASFQLRIVIN